MPCLRRQRVHPRYTAGISEAQRPGPFRRFRTTGFRAGTGGDYGSCPPAHASPRPDSPLSRNFMCAVRRSGRPPVSWPGRSGRDVAPATCAQVWCTPGSPRLGPRRPNARISTSAEVLRCDLSETTPTWRSASSCQADPIPCTCRRLSTRGKRAPGHRGDLGGHDDECALSAAANGDRVPRALRTVAASRAAPTFEVGAAEEEPWRQAL
jgi:hypothetical protein